MNWDLAIERNRGQLLSLIVTLLAEIGLSEGGTVERVSKPLYRDLLRILRKAESAVRRLIYVAARNIVIEPDEARPPSPRPKAPSEALGNGQDTTKPKRRRGMLFKLFDPPRRLRTVFGRQAKRKQVLPPLQVVNVGSNPLLPLYLVFRLQEPPPAPPPVIEDKACDGMVDATKLIRRFVALVDALQDIPRHAMRLARWRARPPEERHPPRSSPLRSGRPPGFRERPKHEVDEILKECDWLARNVHPTLDDTS